MKSFLALTLRMLIREWKSGEVRVLAAALFIAVAAVTTVGFFTDRVDQTLKREANQMLAADLVIVSDTPLDPGIEARARATGLDTAAVVTLPSMVLYGEANQLAEVKAVAPAYPLRGELRLAARPYGPERAAAGGPPRGEAWAEAALFTRLGVRPGAVVELGAARLRLTAVVTREPDRSGDFFNIAPRLLINLEDLAGTELLQPGARARYRLLAAGSPAGVEAYRAATEPTLIRGQRLEGVEEARPELRQALARARQYLGLASLLSVILAAAAVALVARSFARRQLDAAALLRCLGTSQNRILALYSLQFLWLALAAGLAGSLTGFLAQYFLAGWLGSLVAGGLASPGGLPALQGWATALVLMLGFGLPPLAGLRRVSPLRVLRRDLEGVTPVRLRAYLPGLVLLSGLIFWKANSPALGGYVLLGFGAAVAVAAGLAWGLILALQYGSHRLPAAWRYGVRNTRRRAGASIAQVMSFGAGIMALLLLTLVRGDLQASWQESLPADAPNRFVVNIQPDQLAAFEGFLARRADLRPVVYPMIKARLTAIDGRPVSARDYQDERSQKLVEREFNLSSSDTLPPENRLTSGRWWGGDAGTRTPDPQFSVEEGIAEALGIEVGDTLTYLIEGETVTAPVTSLRAVNWNSFRVNFFVVATPGLLDAYTPSYLTSFHLPAAQVRVLDELVRDFPNLTVIDVDAIITQVREIMDKVARALRYVFLFTLASGLVVLYAAVVATRQERAYETAVLRTLGASRRQLAASQVTEFAVIGGLAGAVAAFAATALGYVLSTRVFELTYHFNPWVWALGVGAGAAGVALAGWLGTRQVVNRPPLQSLREWA